MQCTSGDESGATLVGDDGYGEDESEADEVENCEVPYIMLKVSVFASKWHQGQKDRFHILHNQT